MDSVIAVIQEVAANHLLVAVLLGMSRVYMLNEVMCYIVLYMYYIGNTLTSFYIYIYNSRYICIYAHVYIQLHMDIYICVCVYALVCICMYTYTYIHTYIPYLNMYIYIHIHMHKQIREKAQTKQMCMCIYIYLYNEFVYIYRYVIYIYICVRATTQPLAAPARCRRPRTCASENPRTTSSPRLSCELSTILKQEFLQRSLSGGSPQ